MDKKQKNRAILGDLIAPNLDVVFCGTAAGRKSAMTGDYYAARGNRFYSVLYQAGFTPGMLRPRNHKDLLKYNIGLTDLAKHASGTDDKLCVEDFSINRVRSIILQYSPRAFAFNGKKAGKIFLDSMYVDYGKQKMVVGTTKLFVLPSTSGRNARHWDQSHWFELAQSINNRKRSEHNVEK